MAEDMPKHMETRLRELGLSDLEYLGDMAFIIQAKRRGDIKRVERGDSWKCEASHVNSYVVYKTLEGEVREVDGDSIRGFALIETDEGKEGFYIVGPYTINNVEALLCVKRLKTMEDGRILGHEDKSFKLDDIRSVEVMPYEKVTVQ
ncbi:MAG: hypothetical protein DRP09_21210 [Candidatus Thorarchaeota archaeon]|nr:MAG: hypothetical protein DRP09_21210 [Candidatus Thorarchaeota archaeon]